MSMTDMLLTFIGGLLTVQVGLLGWFLNKIWDRLDIHQLRLEENTTKHIKLELIVDSLSKLTEKQEKYQEIAFKYMLSVNPSLKGIIDDFKI